MSWLDKFVDVGSVFAKGTFNTFRGFGEAGFNAVLPAYDLMKAPFFEDDYEGLLPTLWGVTLDRGAQAIGNIAGPDKGIGATIGMLPQPVRSTGNAVFDAMEWTYKEGVSQPLATLITMGSLAYQPEDGMLGDWSTFVDGSQWKQAYEIAETRSLGQSIVLAVGTKNILDDREVRRYQNTDHYWWTTGLFDAVSAIRFDPTAIAGKITIGARSAGRGPIVSSAARSWAAARTRSLEPLTLVGQTGSKLPKWKVDAITVSSNANLQMMLGTAEDIKIDSFLNTVRRVHERNPEAQGVFELFLQANRKDKGHLVTSASKILMPRAAADQSNSVKMIDGWLNSERYMDVDTAIHGLRTRILRDAGHTTAAPEDVDKLAGMLRGTLMNGEKNTAGINSAVDVLAQAYMLSPENANLHHRTWRALLGDQSAVREFAEDFTRITRAEELASTPQQLEFAGEVATPASRATARLAGDDEKVIFDLVYRHLTSSTVRKTNIDSSMSQKVLDFLTDNEDIFPSEFLADAVEDAILRGDDEFAEFIMDMSALADEQEIIMDIAGSQGIDIFKSRATAYIEWARAGFETPNATRLGGWNQQRLDALLKHSGAVDFYEAMFTPKLRAVGQVTDAQDLVAPTLRYLPRVTIQEQVRMTQTFQRGRNFKPIQMAFGMMPHRIVDHAAEKSDVHVERMMDKGYMDEALKAEYRGRYIRAASKEERSAIFDELQSDMLKSVARKYGLSDEDVKIILKHTRIGRFSAENRLNKGTTRFSEVLKDHYVFDDTDRLVAAPLFRTETSKFSIAPDWRGIDRMVARRARRVKKYQREIAGIKTNAIDMYRPRVLGRTGVDKFDSRVLPYTKQRPSQKTLNSQARKAVAREEAKWLNRTGYFMHDGMDTIMRYWTPAALLRPAWALKVVGIDEQIRMFAKFQGLINWHSRLLGEHVGKDGRFANLYEHMAGSGMPTLRALGIDKSLTSAQAVRRSSGAGALFGGIAAGPMGAAVGALAGGATNYGMIRRMKYVQRNPRQLGRTLDDIVIHDIAGSARDDHDLYLEGVSVANHATHRALRGMTDEAEYELRELAKTGNYVAYAHADDPAKWDFAFEETFNNVLGQDTAARRTIEQMADIIDMGFDPSDSVMAEGLADDLATWMKSTRAGKEYASSVKVRSFDDQAKEFWAEQMVETLNKYLTVNGRMASAPGKPRRDTALLRKLIDSKQGRVTAKEWKAQFDSVEHLDLLPNIHGAEISETFASLSPWGKRVSDMIESAYTLMGQFPTDTLSRQPFFKNMYSLEVRRLLANYMDETGQVHISKNALDQIKRSAKETALVETRHTMYELAEVSEFGDLTRFLMPFYGAWQEALTRYVGLAYENPVFAAQALNAWDADIFEEDDNGNEWLVIQLPEWAAGLAENSPIFKDAFANTGQISLNKDAINMFANGLPGFGPLVQYPLARAIEKNPTLEGSLEILFPYGAPNNLLDQFLPAYQRRILSAFQKDSNRSFSTLYRQNLKTALTKMELGERPWVDMNDPQAKREFLEEIEDQTASLMAVRGFASALAPVPIKFDSPYVEYIEMYRELQETSDNADLEFLELYGEDFFALTQATTRTLNGVPPTLWGDMQEERFSNLINNHPELGSLVVGNDSGSLYARFLRTKYDEQLAEGDRVRLSPEETVTQPGARLGWIKYSQIMDYIESERVANGYPNLRVSEAQWLADTKRAAFNELMRENPAFAQDFYEVDRGKWDRRIAGLRDIAATPGLGAPDDKGLTRPDLEPLSDYLETRDYVISELQRRKDAGGSSTLDARSNADLAEFWDNFTHDMVEFNHDFAWVFYRYLDNDPVRAPLTGLGVALPTTGQDMLVP